MDADLWGFSLTPFLRLYHLGHVLADLGLCHTTLDLNYIYNTGLKNSNHTVLPLLLDSVIFSIILTGTSKLKLSSLLGESENLIRLDTSTLYHFGSLR